MRKVCTKVYLRNVVLSKLYWLKIGFLAGTWHWELWILFFAWLVTPRTWSTYWNSNLVGSFSDILYWAQLCRLLLMICYRIYFCNCTVEVEVVKWYTVIRWTAGICFLCHQFSKASPNIEGAGHEKTSCDIPTQICCVYCTLHCHTAQKYRIKSQLSSHCILTCLDIVIL